MNVSPYLKNLHDVEQPQEMVTLGGRMFIMDGVNPNIVFNGRSNCDRIMGCYPQNRVEVPQLAEGDGMSAGGAYSYAIRRCMKLGAMEVKSPFILSEAFEVGFNKLVFGEPSKGLSDFQKLVDGQFKLSVDSVEYEVFGINTSASINMVQVAEFIEGMIIAETNDTTLKYKWVDDTHFEMTSAKSISVLSDVGHGPDSISEFTEISEWLGGTNGVSTTNGALSAILKIEQYEFLSIEEDYQPKIFYQVFRNKVENRTSFYFCKEFSQSEFLALSEVAEFADSDSYVIGDKVKYKGLLWVCLADCTGEFDADDWLMSGSIEFHDTTKDLDLSPQEVIDLDIPDVNQYIPPVRYARVHKGSIICGGSIRFEVTNCTVDSEDKRKIMLSERVPQLKMFVNAQFAIKGSHEFYMITRVDEVENCLYLSEELRYEFDTSGLVIDEETGLPEEGQEMPSVVFEIFRDYSTVFVSNNLPENIEGYEVNQILYSNTPFGRICGIASYAGNCYILREQGIEIIQGQINYSLAPLVGNAPKCASHKTIADDICGSPIMFYYSGNSVVAVQGTGFQIISQPIEKILLEDIDHDYDEFTHGCYNPEDNCYYLWLFGIGDVEKYGLRVPQKMLIYNIALKEWYPCECPASASGVWSDKNGKAFMAVAIAGGVAKFAEQGFDGVDINYKIGVNDEISEKEIEFESLSLPLQDVETNSKGLQGLPIFLFDVDNNFIDKSLIKDNSENHIELFAEFARLPTVGDIIHIGAIQYSFETGEIAFASFDIQKKFDRCVAIAEVAEDIEFWKVGKEYKINERVKYEKRRNGETGSGRDGLEYFITDTQHTATEENKPTAKKEFTAWRVFKVNAVLEVSGTRNSGTRKASDKFDLLTGEKMELTGAKLGIRSRSATIKVSGFSSYKTAVLGADLVEVKGSSRKGRE